MGIQKFHSWLRNNFIECFSKNANDTYNHLYIDLNYLLHLSIYNSKTNDAFISCINHLLDNIIGNHLPTKSLTIAMDGSSPYAKINLQQKRRRTMSSNTNKNSLNPLCLTPGTIFMNNLTSHIQEYFENRKEWFKYTKIKFNLFPTNIAGEGELKLLHQLLINGKDNNDSHLVIGNDADLIVMMMSLKNIANIDLLVKTHKSDGYETISIKKLIKCISNKYCDLNKNINILKCLGLRQDFCILSIMMGNDYFPKLHSVKFDSLWSSYKKTKKNTNRYIIRNNTYDKIFFTKFMKNILSSIAPQYKNINNYNKQEIIEYLEGLLWCLDMYTNGICPKHDFVFKETNIPKPANILYFLENDYVELKIPTSNTKPLDAHICGILLLPRKNKYLLPKKYHDIIDNSLDKFYQIEECNECFKIKTDIKECYSIIYSLEKEDETRINTCKKISVLNKKLKKHLNDNHNDLPSINDVRKIVENSISN